MLYKLPERGPRISETELSQLEHKLGKHLPKEYREFLSQTNGGKTSGLEFRKQNGKVESIDVFHGIRGELELDDILSARALLEDRIGADRFLPIGQTPCGDILILDLESGGIILWIHDAEAEIEILAENFADFWNSLKEPSPEAPECNFEQWRDYSPNWRGRYGHSVVEAAAIAGRVDIVKEWMNGGLSLGGALRYAAMNGNMNVVDFLISKGSDINEVDNFGKTALDWARWQKDFASALRTRGAKTGEEVKPQD